jgi:hypothetical protein
MNQLQKMNLSWTHGYKSDNYITVYGLLLQHLAAKLQPYPGTSERST